VVLKTNKCACVLETATT